MKNFSGKILFLDRSDINTDEIIPAKYLTEITKEALKPFLLEDLKLGDFSAQRDLAGKAAVISRANFGCGSSREHAPWALEVNGINVVIAESFARIFFRNSVATGELYPCESVDRLCDLLKTGEVVTVDLDAATVTAESTGKVHKFKPLGDVRPVVDAGGLFNYARKTGMIAA